MSNYETISARVITIRLRMPALALLVALLVGGLVWAFVLGIMVGRGQMDEQLEAMANASSQTTADATAAQRSDAETDGLIRPEDLQYQQTLRQNQQTPPVVAAAPPVAAVRDQARPQVTAAPAVSGHAYVYQVASYNQESQAKALQTRLEAKGVKTSIETNTDQGVSRFRVLISFSGDDATVADMRNMLKKDFKINEVLQRSKTSLNR